MALTKYNFDTHTVQKTERIISAAVGSALTLYCFRPKATGRIFAAIGAAGLLYRGLTGNSLTSVVYKENQGNTSVAHGQGVKIERSITVMKPRHELYAFWRDFTNLPLFMKDLKRVEMRDPMTSHWVAEGIGGTEIEWDSVIHNEIPGELLSWRTLPESEVQHAGTVLFKESSTGEGTEIKLIMSYDPPAGRMGVLFSKLIGKDPAHLMNQDLRRFKQLMETGEIASTEGQPTGRFSNSIKTFERSVQ